ncbi:dihydropteroate synthase-like protein [archaeon]|nr:dihydropteroate synthase-like protein [archaeon]
MKILLITGRSKEKEVRKIAKRFACDVHVAPVEVASLLTPDMIARGVKEGHKMIIVPGLVKVDLKRIEKEAGVAAFKGPRDIADLALLLENIDSIKLSKDVPADGQLAQFKREMARDEIERVNSAGYAKKMKGKPGNISIGGLAVGHDFPIRVVSEIVDVGGKPLDLVRRIAKYYVESGTDVIDLGFNEENPEKIKEVVPALRDLKIPLSIDTMEEKNIECAIDEGIDLILSFDDGLIKKFKNVEAGAVILPMKNGIIPDDPVERVEILGENIKLARKRGFKKPIADPVLKPINFGLADSIVAYRLFGIENPDIQMLMGIGNVTELTDADSPGINAVLCGLAGEVGAAMVFTTEASSKTKGSVAELATASKMMHLARIRGSPPKDLGLDMLRLKKKRSG